MLAQTHANIGNMLNPYFIWHHHNEHHMDSTKELIEELKMDIKMSKELEENGQEILQQMDVLCKMI